MSENNLPSAKSEPEAAPGEFDFAAPVTERPRVRRRALTQATTPKPAQETPAPEKVAPAEPRATTTPPTASSTSSQPAAKPASTQPKTAASHPASPHGTRPATLYYSSGSRQDKETTSSMKTTPSSSPTASTAAPAASATRTSAATTRPSGVVDYRTNVERQSREQKSVGGVLSIVVYTLIGLFIIGASLAGYGAYVITKQLDKQSVTMKDFDARYAADYKDINGRLVTTMDNLTAAQAQIERQQTLITKQQESINKLLSASEDTAAALKMERATRAQETANLRARLKDLEYTGPSSRKY